MDQQLNKDLAWLKMCQAGASIMVKCSKAQYFAYIIDDQGRVRGCGYNGTPSGMTNCTEGGCPRAANNVPSGTPYNYGDGLCFSNHAEMNAIMGIDRAVLVRCTLYVNGICCFGCAKEIAGAGIKRVVGLLPERGWPEDYKVSKRTFVECGIEWLFAKEAELATATDLYQWVIAGD